jgi:anti-sigma B factor antagonist
MPGDDGDRAARTSKLGSLALRSERAGDAHLLELIGELDLDGAPRLEEELARVEAGDAETIVLDLGRLDFIDSTGIRLIVMACERWPGGRLSLLRGPKQVHRVFELTDLAHRLPFAD